MRPCTCWISIYFLGRIIMKYKFGISFWGFDSVARAGMRCASFSAHVHITAVWAVLNDGTLGQRRRRHQRSASAI
jgi:hypothetical protein